MSAEIAAQRRPIPRPTEYVEGTLPCKLTGRRDFLYVADCKLATAENMAHLHQHGGRFLTILPRTRGEDAAFRESVRGGHARWKPIHDKHDDQGEV